jgi:hypothetical protein
MAAIVGSEPLSLAELQPWTPPMLERLIGRCLAKDVRAALADGSRSRH